jgi:hypothetical protein
VITWHVHVVNRKGAAPKFEDPNTGLRNTNPALRRNNAANNNNLDDPTNKPLIINPAKQSVTSADPQPVELKGAFRDQPVSLGRVFTRTPGRLIFVGGKGGAASVPANQPLGSFADSDNWYDDSCDGSVEANLLFSGTGQQATARPAWVISGPFDFAPEINNLVSVYDILCELAVDRNLLAFPNPVYFDKHIFPILARVVGYQWVNRYARSKHGKGQQYEFTAAAWQDLGDPTSASGSTKRKMLRDHLRPPGASGAPMAPEMPLQFSDNYPADPSVLWFTKLQYGLIEAWANDQFQATAPPEPPELLPTGLTRMALEACIGRAFFPGIEVSILIYDSNIFFASEPFRIANPGPIQPGILTQSMALPWQSDFLACQWEGSGIIGKAWWPAQRPDDVLPEQAPGNAVPWARGIMGRADMIARWHKLGIVRKVASGDYVETERAL